MYYVAGALLLAQVGLLWVLDDSVDLEGLEYLAGAIWFLLRRLAEERGAP